MTNFEAIFLNGGGRQFILMHEAQFSSVLTTLESYVFY